MGKVLTEHVLPRSVAIGAALAISFAVLTVPAEAQSLSRTLRNFVILGFAAEFAGSMLDDDGNACRTTGEAMTAAAATGATGALVGAVAGGIAGIALDGNVGTGVLTGIVGGIAGRSLLTGIAGEAGQAAGAELFDEFGEDALMGAMRDYGENFEYATCRILEAAAIVRKPLVDAYFAAAQRACPFEPDSLGSEAQTAELIACTNNSSDEARAIVADIVAINRATCGAIQQLGRSVVQRQADLAMQRGSGSTMPFYGTAGHPDEWCANGTLRDIWGDFVEDRINVERATNPSY